MAKREFVTPKKSKDSCGMAESGRDTDKRQGDPEASLLSIVTGDNPRPTKRLADPIHDRGNGKHQGDSEARLVGRVADKYPSSD